MGEEMADRLPSFPVEGGCLCGAIRFRLSAAPLGVYNCHCKDCQRTSGADYSASMIVRRADFTVLQGETIAFDKPADSGRTVRQHSCPVCSIRVFHEPLATPDFIVMRPGTLDDSRWARPIGNIWTDSRAPWVEIDPDVPNFPGQPPSREPLMVAWQKHMGLLD
jgi:hypothetical protein